MKKKNIPILFEDQAILVCEKPIGMPSQSDKSRDIDLITSLKLTMFERDQMTEEPSLFIVNRLDRPVGGVMVLAKTKEAAAELSRQIREHTFEKNYQAVVCGYPEEEFGSMTDYLLKDGKSNTTKVVSKKTQGAKIAELDYELIDSIETKEGVLSWLMITLHTGRHHQIRVQFASRDLGLYGDTKYNPRFQKEKKKYRELGLYSTRIAFKHPVSKEKISFKTDPQGQAFELMDVETY